MRKRKETSTTTEKVFISPWRDEIFEDQEDYDMLTDINEFEKGKLSSFSLLIVQKYDFNEQTVQITYKNIGLRFLSR